MSRAGVAGRVAMGLSGLIFVAPSLSADMLALLVAGPVIAAQLVGKRREGIAA